MTDQNETLKEALLREGDAESAKLLPQEVLDMTKGQISNLLNGSTQNTFSDETISDISNYMTSRGAAGLDELPWEDLSSASDSDDDSMKGGW